MQMYASSEHTDITFSFVKRISKQHKHFNFITYPYSLYIHVKHIMNNNKT